MSTSFKQGDDHCSQRLPRIFHNKKATSDAAFGAVVSVNKVLTIGLVLVMSQVT